MAVTQEAMTDEPSVEEGCAARNDVVAFVSGRSLYVDSPHSIDHGRIGRSLAHRLRT